MNIHYAIDLTRNENQKSYFNEVMLAVAGKVSKRVFGYGGAIRGGKTYVSLFILMILCKKFARSRWHVVREDMPALKGTSIPSMEKLIGFSPNWRWSRDSSNYFVEYINGSRIFFKGENITSDPELNDFLGLETNGILLEQAEELQEKTFDITLSRTGSWYIDPMPPAFIFLTFNPSQTWTKTKLYEPWISRTLPATFHYQPALPKDNPYVTEDQWNAWELMADRYKAQFIEGNWTDFDIGQNAWAFAFDEQKHVGFPELNRAEPVYLSFDFNRNPISCLVIQHYIRQINVLRTIKIPNSGVDELCDKILQLYPRCLFIVTGDYSGHNAQSILKEEVTHYKMIQYKLKLSHPQIQVSTNPSLRHNQVLVNSILANYKIQIHKTDAASLIFDMRYVKKLPDGTIEKTDRNIPEQQADSLDTFRYWCNQFMKDYINLYGL